jgi:hypothetical protein
MTNRFMSFGAALCCTLVAILGAACGGNESTTPTQTSSAVTCHAVIDYGDGGGPSCGTGWTSCSDGHAHTVECADNTAVPYECTCAVSQQPSGTFSTQDFCALVWGADSDALLAAANAACGWNLHL